MKLKNVLKGVFITGALLCACLLCQANVLADEAAGKSVRILFTHDIHSYLDVKSGMVDGQKRQYGGAARLSTLLKQEKNDHSIYVDAGDFAMGTLYQASFSTGAYELRTLGKLGCAFTTFGNHEFDYGLTELSASLNNALAVGQRLPRIVEASFNFDGQLTPEQEEFYKTCRSYGIESYYIEEVGGVKIGFFGLEGPDSIECVQSDINFYDYIDVAKKVVDELKDQCDLIVCLSHVGTNGDGETGEDFDLIEAVPGIDVIVSGHSHTAYSKPVTKNGTILVSAGSYLQNLGELDIKMGANGVEVENYRLIPIDDKIAQDLEIAGILSKYKEEIRSNYLAKYANGGNYDTVLAASDYDFMSLEEMYATHQEYPLGNLIADSYKYIASMNGINDIDVALVGLGTIRGSIMKGDVRLADAFEICSLGVGGDASAGHPLLCAYITGEELKLLCELDASLGPMVSSIKMSYSGLNYTFNSNRTILDRITSIYLVDENGHKTDIDDEKLYKVCCNMYAANMLDMLNGLTGGILSIVPKDADGNPVTDFYSVSMKDSNGNEVKEWVALAEYLASFEDGKIPEEYSKQQGRKTDTGESGLAVLKDPGLTTFILCFLIMIILVLISLISVKTTKKIKTKRAIKRGEIPPEPKKKKRKNRKKRKLKK